MLQSRWVHDKNSNQWMLILLTISISIGIPVINEPSFSISLTDCLVALFLPVALFRILSHRKKLSMTLPDLGIFVFALAILISLLAHFRQGILLSVLGLTRVVLFYITVKMLFSLSGIAASSVLNRAFSFIIYLMVGAGLLDFLLFAFGISNPFILVRDYYYGLVPIQLSGVDGHPNGAAQLIFISALVVFFTHSNEKKIPYFILLVALAGLVLTQAKSCLLYLAVSITVNLLWSNSSPLKRWLGYVTSTGLIIVYLLISHFFPVNNKDMEVHRDQIPEYLDTSFVLSQSKHYNIYPTHYTTNKIAAWTCFKSYPWMGIGPRNYIPYVDSLQKEGAYPVACRFKNPHCMYTGILAKFGFIGLVGLMGLIILIFISIKKIPVSGMKILFAGLFTALFFDAFTSDMEYSRVGWFIVTWLTSYISGESGRKWPI